MNKEMERIAAIENAADELLTLDTKTLTELLIKARIFKNRFYGKAERLHDIGCCATAEIICREALKTLCDSALSPTESTVIYDKLIIKINEITKDAVVEFEYCIKFDANTKSNRIKIWNDFQIKNSNDIDDIREVLRHLRYIIVSKARITHLCK